MAKDLSISASYLNLVESNQRPLTTQLVLKLSAIYDLDLRELRVDREAKRAAELTEIFADPAFGVMPAPTVITDLVNGYPDIAAAFTSLYGAYRKALAHKNPGADDSSAELAPSHDERFPVEEVRDYFHARHNYIPSLDLAAEALYAQLAADDLFPALRSHLLDTHQVRVSILPIHAMPDHQRRFDRHNKRLFLSEMLSIPGRVFQTAVQIALLSYGAEFDRLIGEAALSGEDANHLFRIGLANHFAGALMMPYGRFVEAATSVRYDIDVLASRFGASIEQVAHRLTTLQRGERRGIPFFLLRLDQAGNISKRFSGSGIHIARFGAACPRWNVYDAFATPGMLRVQVSQMPDGSSFFCVAKTISPIGRQSRSRPIGARLHRLAIGLGCPLSYATDVTYADGLALDDPKIVTPIGVSCRVCERVNCPERAMPSRNYNLVVDENRRGLSAYCNP